MKARHLSFYYEPPLKSPILLAVWREDAGGLGPGIGGYLVEKLGMEKFGAIEPLGFFPVGEVEIKDDLIQFWDSAFYSTPSGNLILFWSDAPRYEWYRFLGLILDVADKYRARGFYTIGGMVTLVPHTAPRNVLTISNSPGIKQELARMGFLAEMDFSTPPGGRPTLNSFLLWIARQRNIPGASLWVEVPFYLSGVNDLTGKELSIDFLNSQLALGLDIAELRKQAAEQESKLRELRAEKPLVDGYISKLERGESLAQEEGETLVREIQERLDTDVI